jgi:hypothetical protein
MVSSETICLPKNAGPQILAPGRGGATVHFAERRCAASGAFTASPRQVQSASLYGIGAFAVTWLPRLDALAVTDPAGYLTIYKTPQAALRQ